MSREEQLRKLQEEVNNASIAIQRALILIDKIEDEMKAIRLAVIQ